MLRQDVFSDADVAPVQKVGRPLDFIDDVSAVDEARIGDCQETAAAADEWHTVVRADIWIEQEGIFEQIHIVIVIGVRQCPCNRGIARVVAEFRLLPLAEGRLRQCHRHCVGVGRRAIV